MYVGFTKVDITPEPGLPMAGYVNRKGKSIGAHDPLYARILYMDDSNRELLLISLDLIRIDNALYNDIIQVIEKNYGLSRNNIIIAATHTHSGPEVSLGLWSTKELSNDEKNQVEKYLRELTWKINNGVSIALEKSNKITSIQALNCRVNSNVATNRVDSRGLVDKESTLLYIKYGSERVLIVNYACHPTVLGPDNLLYSGDLAGFTIKHIEENLGINALYFNGAAGNVSTRFSRSKQDFDEAKYLSNLLARPIIEKIVYVKEEMKANNSLCIHTKTITETLRLREPVDTEKLTKIEQQLLDRLEKAKKNNAPPGVLRALESDVYAIRIAKRRNMLLKNTRTIKVKIHVARIGDNLLILSFPGELFIEYQLELKNLAKPRKVMLIGYSNGYIGYVPYPSYTGKLCYEEIVSLIDNNEYDKIRALLQKAVLGDDLD